VPGHARPEPLLRWTAGVPRAGGTPISFGPADEDEVGHHLGVKSADGPGPEAPPSFVEPSFGQRVGAWLIDGLVAVPVILLVGTMTEGSVRRALGLALSATYQVAFVVRRGQTPGKIAMGTRIVDYESGSLPSLTQAATRWLVVVAGTVASLVLPALQPFTLFYDLIVMAPILRAPLHRGVHDHAAGTIVSSLRPVTVPG
jgi:uncharacterized RDD family membrane protein YckC